MPDGKTHYKFTLLLGLILLALSKIGSAQNPTSLRGGLVFTKESDDEALFINQDYYPTMRVANTTQLAESAQTTADLTTRYSRFCDRIATEVNIPIFKDREEERRLSTNSTIFENHSKDATYELLASAITQQLLYAPQYCRRAGARLPEIRGVDSRERLRKFALDNGVTLIYSGIYLDIGYTFRFKSDDSLLQDAVGNIRPRYGGSYGDKDYDGSLDNYYVLNEAKGNPIIYKNPSGDFHVRIASTKDVQSYQRIICERDISEAQQTKRTKVDPQTSLAYHACLRDEKPTTDSVRNQVKDIEAITTLKLEIVHKSNVTENFFPQEVRRKRKRQTTKETFEAFLDKYFNTTLTQENEVSQLPEEPLLPQALTAKDEKVEQEWEQIIEEVMKKVEATTSTTTTTTWEPVTRPRTTTTSTTSTTTTTTTTPANIDPAFQMENYVAPATNTELQIAVKSVKARSSRPRYSTTTYLPDVTVTDLFEIEDGNKALQLFKQQSFMQFTPPTNIVTWMEQLPPEPPMYKRFKFHHTGRPENIPPEDERMLYNKRMLERMFKPIRVRRNTDSRKSTASKNLKSMTEAPSINEENNLQAQTEAPSHVEDKPATVAPSIDFKSLHKEVRRTLHENRQKVMLKNLDYTDDDESEFLRIQNDDFPDQSTEQDDITELEMFINMVSDTMKGAEENPVISQLVNELHTYWLYSGKAELRQDFTGWITERAHPILIKDIDYDLFFNEREFNDHINLAIDIEDPNADICTVFDATNYIEKAVDDNIKQMFFYIKNPNFNPVYHMLRTNLGNLFKTIASAKADNIFKRLADEIQEDPEKILKCISAKPEPEESASKPKNIKHTKAHHTSVDYLSHDSIITKSNKPHTFMPWWTHNSDRYPEEWKKEEIGQINQRFNHDTTDINEDTTTLVNDHSHEETTSHYDDVTKTSHKTRTKRAHPAIPLAIAAAGANVISSMITGEAPLSWFGKALGATFGLATADEIHAFTQQMEQTKQKVQDLQINDHELQLAILEVQRYVRDLTSVALASNRGTALITMEQDLKAMIRHMLFLQEATLLKYANILVAARTGHASPYALTEKELKEIAARALETKGIILETDISKIKTMVVVEDNTIKIFFNIPIKVEKQLFTLMKVDALPVFTEDKVFYPEIEHRHLGMSKSHSEYIILKPEEYTVCKNDPQECQVTSPITPITLQSHCVITTYMTQKLTCPLVERPNGERRAIIQTNGNHTIYSVPSPMQIFVKCDDTDASHRYVDDTAQLDGMGEITFRSGCTITAPDGTKWRTPMIHPLEEIKKTSKLFSLLRTFSLPKNTTFSFVSEKDLPPMHEPELRPDITAVATWEGVRDQAFNPHQYFPFLVRLASVIGLAIVAGIALYCCYYKCRKRYGPAEWCPCVKPFPADTPELVTYDDFNQQMRQLQNTMRNSFQNFRASTRSIFESRQRSKSTTDINSEAPQEESFLMGTRTPSGSQPNLIRLKDEKGSTYIYQPKEAGGTRPILKVRSPSVVKFDMSTEQLNTTQ